MFLKLLSPLGLCPEIVARNGAFLGAIGRAFPIKWVDEGICCCIDQTGTIFRNPALLLLRNTLGSKALRVALGRKIIQEIGRPGSTTDQVLTLVLFRIAADTAITVIRRGFGKRKVSIVVVQEFLGWTIRREGNHSSDPASRAVAKLAQLCTCNTVVVHVNGQNCKLGKINRIHFFRKIPAETIVVDYKCFHVCQFGQGRRDRSRHRSTGGINFFEAIRKQRQLVGERPRHSIPPHRKLFDLALVVADDTLASEFFPSLISFRIVNGIPLALVEGQQKVVLKVPEFSIRSHIQERQDVPLAYLVGQLFVFFLVTGIERACVTGRRGNRNLVLHHEPLQGIDPIVRSEWTRTVKDLHTTLETLVHGS
mmetsp:Transcript_9129/g.22665  ORF Transcript_9129/g.22665 Transcript_9129/m.22665 type:complete len:366 (+) Transcript_9129:211-1308(+)